MGRLIALLLGGFGLGAYLRRRSRRPALPAAGSSPAEELRAKLAESRTGETAPGAEIPPAETPPEPAPEADLDARRRDVHERARGAIDELS